MPGGVMVIVQDGAVILARGFGHADLDRQTPVDPERTLFYLASVTKCFTATAVMQQVEQGRLRTPSDGHFTVEVLLVDGTLFPHRGRITFAAPSYNAQTGTFLLRASVDNPDGILRPNAYVRVRLTGASRPNSILVPQRSVQQGLGGPVRLQMAHR